MLDKIKAIKEENNYSSNENQIIVDNEKDMSDIFINFFKESKKIKNKNIRTQILDKIINEKKIGTELFVFQIKEEDYEIEPYFNVLKDVIEYFKSEHVDEKKWIYLL